MRSSSLWVVSSLSFCAYALPDTKVTSANTCAGKECLQGVHLDFPEAVYPVTPRFPFSITGSVANDVASPVFEARGSLGLPGHPLGIFGFNITGQACGQQTLDMLDGVLATITVNFPACPWSGTINITGRADVWTTIPAVPILPVIGISTGFTLNLLVSEDSNWEVDTRLRGGPPLLNLTVDLAQAPGKGADPTQDKCALDTKNLPEYPPKGDNWTMPTFTVDLDKDPADRWTDIVKPLSKDIMAMIQQFMDAELHGAIKSPLVKAILDLGTDELLKRVPSPYDDEMRGIAKATGLHVTYIFVYNIMYEVMGLCTSLVANDKDGHVYHARNLDFGLFMGTDNTTHNWALTQKLRPLLMQLNFVRGGVTLYQTTQYAGYIGLLTGMRKDGFAITVDSRFDGNLDKFLLAWILGKYDGEFLSWKTRTVMENFDTYPNALKALTHWKPMGPCYVIVSGAKSKEGAVLQLGANRETPLLVRSLADENASNYVAQTNYDWPAAPPAFDDRRYPVVDCLNKLGKEGVSYQNLWGVMSSNPTKNALTTYTTLMSAETGHFEAYQQFCAPGPTCNPFLARDYQQLDALQREVEFVV